MGGIFKSNSNKNSQATTTQDNRQVMDASGGGKVIASGGALAEGSGSVTNVNGSNNSITDGGAFEIVAKLADQLANVSAMQTTVARDIALRGTPAGTAYANAAVTAQEAALAEAEAPELNTKTAAALAVAGLVGVYLWNRK